MNFNVPQETNEYAAKALGYTYLKGRVFRLGKVSKKSQSDRKAIDPKGLVKTSG